MRMRLEIHGCPKAQPRPRAFFNKHTGRAQLAEKGTAEEWKSAIARAVLDCPSKPVDPYEGSVVVITRFRMPRPKAHFNKGGLTPRAPRQDEHTKRPDTDNLEKAVLDCLSDLKVWRDDSQVGLLLSHKRWTTRTPGASILIVTMENQLARMIIELLARILN